MRKKTFGDIVLVFKKFVNNSEYVYVGVYRSNWHGGYWMETFGYAKVSNLKKAFGYDWETEEGDLYFTDNEARNISHFRKEDFFTFDPECGCGTLD